MLEYRNWKTAAAAPAPAIEAVPGFPLALDEAAQAADPHHRFLRAAWFAASGGADPQTLVVRRAGAVVAAIPTVRTGRFGVRAVPGCYWPFRGPPIASDSAAEELAAAFAAPEAAPLLGWALRLGPIMANDATARQLGRAAEAAGWSVLSRRIGTTFLLDLGRLAREGRWPRGSTMRKNRFHEKNLAAHGTLEWRFISGDLWSPAVFDDLARIEAASWIASKTDGRDSKFLNPAHRKVWESAATDPALARMMSAAILDIGGRPAAFSFDLDCGPVKYAVANSYDEAFARHSPGKVLYYRNLVRAMERGIGLVDWGVGDGGYKRTIGAEAGPEMVDLLFVRNRAAAALLRPLWQRSGRG
jgi:CelD/BcsL family acetyltransferase involved in cellulose biosynthesis